MPDIHLESLWDKSRGVIGRYPGENERYVMAFDTAKKRGVHMIGVRKPLRVSWLANEKLVESAVLRPLIGYNRQFCDTIIEECP